MQKAFSQGTAPRYRIREEGVTPIRAALLVSFGGELMLPGAATSDAGTVQGTV
jgi:hypothetical protein